MMKNGTEKRKQVHGFAVTSPIACFSYTWIPWGIRSILWLTWTESRRPLTGIPVVITTAAAAAAVQQIRMRRGRRAAAGEGMFLWNRFPVQSCWEEMLTARQIKRLITTTRVDSGGRRWLRKSIIFSTVAGVCVSLHTSWLMILNDSVYPSLHLASSSWSLSLSPDSLMLWVVVMMVHQMVIIFVMISVIKLSSPFRKLIYKTTKAYGSSKMVNRWDWVWIPWEVFDVN